MTDRLHDDQLDSELRRFLAWQAEDVGGAPTAIEVARRIDAGAGTRTLGLPLTPKLVWMVVVGLLVMAVVVAGAGAILQVRNRLVDEAPKPPGPPGNGWIAISANPISVMGGEVGDIYRVADGAAPQRIIGSAGDGIAQACPQFSPDGQRLAYGEARASGVVTTFRGVWPVEDRAVVVVAASDAGDVSPSIVRVSVDNGSGEIVCPEWSPNGKQLAFREGSELRLVDATSGETTVVEVSAAPWGQREFEWSRDGSRVAVAEPGQIRVVPIDGDTPTILSVEGATPGSLAWTAGDAGIVYTSTDEPGDGRAINVIVLDTGTDSRLTPDATGLRDRFDPAVSPEGTRVAYLQRTYRCDGVGCTQDQPRIWIVDADGSDRIELPIPPGMGASKPVWSPDGQRLLFGSIAGIVSIAVAPGSPKVVHASGSELNLEWSGSEVTWQPVFE